MLRCPVWLPLALLCFAPVAARAGCPVFVLERDSAGVRVERLELADGEVQVLQRDVAHGTLDLVLPTGPGRSAALLRASDADRIVVRFAAGRLSAQVRRADGSSVELPTRTLAELRAQDIRASVTLGEAQYAFVIAGYERASADDIGPAENMFAGRLPAALTRDAAIVQTDTWVSAPASPACGRAPLERERWLFVRGARADGVAGWFVLDLAASESIVARSFVPSGQKLEELSMVEHSAGGTRQLPYAPAGATGAVAGVLGHSSFAKLTFGSLAFANADVTVLDRLPDVFGRPVVGILGMDLLRGCAHLQLEFAPGGKAGTLALASAAPAGTPTARTPFSLVSSHVLVAGSVDGAKARWILDSGSPGMVIDSLGAPAFTSRATTGALRGLDGAGTAATTAVAQRVAVGALEHAAVPVRVASLPVFAPFRARTHALGVLGVSELARVRALDIDWAAREVRWYR
ncbi:MAG: hypothetical protein ABL977_14650 [Candidatus Eisenbacteria bacterium]